MNLILQAVLFLILVFLACLPGKIKMKMAAKAPNICITTPIFGMKIASTRVMANHTVDTTILRNLSFAIICSSVKFHTAFHKQSNAPLKWPHLVLQYKSEKKTEKKCSWNFFSWLTILLYPFVPGVMEKYVSLSKLLTEHLTRNTQSVNSYSNLTVNELTQEGINSTWLTPVTIHVYKL